MPRPTEPPAPTRRSAPWLLPDRARRVLVAVVVGLGVVYISSVLLRHGGGDASVDGAAEPAWLTAVGSAAGVLGLFPMLRRRGAPGFATGTTALLYAATLLGSSLVVVPEADHTLADESAAGVVAWLAPYPLLALLLVLLARARLKHVPASVWLDGALFGSAVGALLGATVLAPVLRAAGSTLAAAVFTLDLALIGFTLGIGAATAWRKDRQLALVVLGACCLAGSDLSAILQINRGGWHLGFWNDAFFAAAVLLVEASAWRQPEPALMLPSLSPRVLVVPLAAAATAVGVLVAGSLVAVPWGAVALAGIALVVALGRWVVDALQARGAAQHRALALMDELTGIANRRALYSVLDPLCTAEGRPGLLLLLLIDLDAFKAVNDRHGHQIGDEVLVAVSRRLAESGPEAVVARLGGDEFAVAALVQDEDEAWALGRRLQAALAPPLREEVAALSGEIRLGSSIGGVWAGAVPVPRSELLRAADRTMYAVKRTGGGLFLAGLDPRGTGPDAWEGGGV